MVRKDYILIKASFFFLLKDILNKHLDFSYITINYKAILASNDVDFPCARSIGN